MPAKLPKPSWVRRNFRFDKLKVGEELEEFNSINYFRSRASAYFNAVLPKRTYTTFKVTGTDGRTGVKLVRLS